jgi:phosphohistidine phosphatase SixA
MIVFVLRHADRKPEPADELTARGRERAELLARMLGESGISAAFRTEFVRARQTLEPLERARGSTLSVKIVPSENVPTSTHVQQVIEAVRSRPPNAVVAVVGHSDTVGEIVEGLLGGQPVEPIRIGANEFDRLFILFIDPPRPARLLRLRYGEPT